MVLLGIVLALTVMACLSLLGILDAIGMSIQTHLIKKDCIGHVMLTKLYL